MRILLASFLGLAVAPPAAAQTEDRADRIVAAWTEWVEAGGTAASTIAVLHAGELVAEQGIGTAPDTPMPLASLSKAVTAACLAKLSGEGVLRMDATLGDLLD
ncbi:MAG: serine hydrolase, partial [Jannaschia sp.]